MKLYLRGNVWWARWTEAGTKHRRSCKTTHRDEAASVVSGWGRKVDVMHPRVVKSRPAPAPPSAGAMTRGLIYFAHADGTDRIKIGFTRLDEVGRRLRGVQTGCPYPVVLLAALPATKLEELHYHRIFADFRVMRNAEWFINKPPVMSAIQRAQVGESVCPRCTRPTGQ